MWVEKPHICDVPVHAHGAVAKVGAFFECDYCHTPWKVQARVTDTENEGFYKLTFINRQGDWIRTISWE